MTTDNEIIRESLFLNWQEKQIHYMRLITNAIIICLDFGYTTSHVCLQPGNPFTGFSR